jgi:hypothetical protein
MRPFSLREKGPEGPDEGSARYLTVSGNQGDCAAY